MLLDTKTSLARIVSYAVLPLFIGNMPLLLYSTMLIPLRGQTGTYVLLLWSSIYTHKVSITGIHTFMGTPEKRLMRSYIYAYKRRLEKYTTALHLYISDIPRLHQFL
jgi:hypothetical protein